MMRSLFVCTLVMALGCGKKNDAPAETKASDTPAGTAPAPSAAPSEPAATPAAPSATGTPSAAGGCGTYAELTVKCANGVGEAKLIEASCAKTLERNNAMTPTMKVMVDCAGKASGDCDTFQKCIANTR